MAFWTFLGFYRTITSGSFLFSRRVRKEEEESGFKAWFTHVKKNKQKL